jgi:hypothetical protein
MKDYQDIHRFKKRVQALVGPRWAALGQPTFEHLPKIELISGREAFKFFFN